MIGQARICFEKDFILSKGCKVTCVYIGLWEDGTEIAVKRMLNCSVKQSAENEKTFHELPKMKDAKNVLKYRYFGKDKDFSYLVLDLCDMALKEFVESKSLDFL